MRLMLLGGGGGAADSVEANLTLSVEVSGGTPGVIATGVMALCHTNFITTSDGTVLMANGYQPMLRMRQNEKSLTLAGVPAPKTPLRILTAEEIAADPATQIPQATYRTLRFDYTAYGSHCGTRSFGATTSTGTVLDRFDFTQRPVDVAFTPLGAASRDKRHEDWMRLIREIGDDEELVNSSGDAYSKEALRNIFLLPYRYNGDQLAWRNLVITLNIRNRASTVNEDIYSTYSGRYQAFMRYVDKDGRVSNPSPISADAVLVLAPYVYYADVEVPADPRIKRRQIFRNLNGESDAFYLDIDTDDLTSTHLVSYMTDAQLELEYGHAVFDANGYNLFFLYGEPPSDKPYITEYGGRIFAGGSRKYREGVVSVVNGSDEVYGIGTEWDDAFVGRAIILDSVIYVVTMVDEGAQKITIGSPYTGEDSPYLAYSIQPYYANANLLYYTEAGYPEAWGVQNTLLLPEDNDQMTGMVTFADAAWVMKNRSIYNLSYTSDPGRDGSIKPATSRGCFNQRCAIQVQNVCLMLDRIGVHVFKGDMPRYNYQANATPDHLSAAVGDLFRLETAGIRLNLNADKCFWSGVHYEELHTARWFVAMQGYELPQHALCYDYLYDRWSIEEYPFPITSACQQPDMPGRPIVGGAYGKVYQPDNGPLDLINTGNTYIQVDTALSPVTLLLSGTVPDCEGVPVGIAKGTGRGQMRTIVRQDGNIIELDYPLSIMPDDTSYVQIGAISYTVITPEFDYAKWGFSNPNAFKLTYKPSEAQQYAYVSILKDGVTQRTVAVAARWGNVRSTPDDNTVYCIDLAHQAGTGEINMDKYKERDVPWRNSVQATLTGMSGEERPQIKAITFVGAGADPQGTE